MPKPVAKQPKARRKRNAQRPKPSQYFITTLFGERRLVNATVQSPPQVKTKGRNPTSVRFTDADMELLTHLQAYWRTDGPTTTLRRAMQECVEQLLEKPNGRKGKGARK